MTDSTGRPRRTKFDRIRRSPEAAAAAADDLDSGDITKRLDDLELRLEQVALAESYLGAFKDYCVSLRADQEALTWIRWVAVIFAFFFIVLMVGGLAFFMFFRGALFWMISDISLAAIVVGVLGGAAGILLALLKGSFRTIAERNNDDVVPEHMKALLEAAKAISGK